MKAIIRGILSTSRPATSLVFALSGGILLYSTGADTEEILPILLLCTLLCFITFTINDLIDAEQDKINHPRRFLVVNPRARRASTAYYLVLVALYCILSTEIVDGMYRWAYMALLVFFINYSITKANIPLIKNIYISLLCVAFCFSTLAYFGHEADLYIVASSLVFMFAREILMDMPDVNGDQDSIAKRLGPRNSMLFITTLSGVAATILAFGLWSSQPILIPLGYIFPSLLCIRMRHPPPLRSVDAFTRLTTGLPYLYCASLVISS